MDRQDFGLVKRLLSQTVVILFCLFAGSVLAGEDSKPPETHRQRVLRDRPVAYWCFDEDQGNVAVSQIEQEKKFAGTLEGAAKLGQPGPRGKVYPDFNDQNRALTLGSGKSLIRIGDPGDDGFLDFADGDSITMEAWVKPQSLADGQQVYIVGKGRTNNDGFPRENQNYALRLRGIGGAAHVSFLFRTATKQQYHRWNSDLGFLVDGMWHHVAVVYTFGKPDEIRAYVDGQESVGSWDMGGPTTEPPVVDNDEVWIGSSLGGSPGCTFHGQIDEVAIYRERLAADRLIERYHVVKPDPREAEFAAAEDLRAGVIVAEIHEGLPSGMGWPLPLRDPVLRYTPPVLAFVGVPKKYTATGVIADRGASLLLRARMRMNVSDDQAGEYELLLRGRNAARLMIDGKLTAQTAATSRNSSGHEAVPELADADRQDLRLLPPGCQEQLVKVNLTEGEHIIRLDAAVGGKGLRLELQELCVAIAKPGGMFTLLTPADGSPVSLTDDDWELHRARLLDQIATIDRQSRQEAARDWQHYWQQRHEFAREVVSRKSPLEIPSAKTGGNAIDQFIGATLAAKGIEQAPLTDDFAFLRRVTLDTVGVVPSRDEIAQFLDDVPAERRSKAIDRLLDDPRWADHWVGYWQDVLAENPGILKPKLNNTGPFRWWIYESFLDNKPLDRFATELVMMEGSRYYGGPAGFAMATQNDVPMASKAHVLSKAFLAMDMTCARCHDAPYHPFKQRELFSLAALLERKPLTLPKTSSVPIREGARKPLVEITLKPGETIEPAWPFAGATKGDQPEPLPRYKSDPREQFALALTSPHNDRFAKVLVNRLWRRYLGQGLIEPVDDWESSDGNHPHANLLEYLGRQFAAGGYDLKQLAKLIFNSHAYQRQIIASTEQPELFASPARRRMTAEQLVDSLFFVAGKPMRSESLTLDPDGRRPVDTFLNLGQPTRAWHFTSLSNERDRPALALPAAQSVIDLLVAFGWRDSRPNPLTARDETPTVLQPLALANGIVGTRAVRLSDDHAITQLCLTAKSPEALVDDLFLQILSRPAVKSEQDTFVSLVSNGFSKREVKVKQQSKKRRRRDAVSWSNHLSAEATKIKLEREREVRAGDPPTARLDPEWRERMEDAVWALINSPEFVFIP